MKLIIKFEPVPAQNGAPEQVRAFVDMGWGSLESEPYPTRNEAIKHLIRLDPDLFKGGYEIEEAAA